MFNPCCCCTDLSYGTGMTTWTTISGTWSGTNGNQTASTNAIKLSPVNYRTMYAQISIGGSSDTTARIIVDYRDSNNYKFVEWKRTERYMRITEILAGVETDLASVSGGLDSPSFAGCWVSVADDAITAVWTPDNNFASQSLLNQVAILTASTSHNNGSIGIGTGATVSGTLQFARGALCSADNIIQSTCNADSPPGEELEIVISGVANSGGFPGETLFNGTHTAVLRTINFGAIYGNGATSRRMIYSLEGPGSTLIDSFIYGDDGSTPNKITVRYLRESAAQFIKDITDNECAAWSSVNVPVNPSAGPVYDLSAASCLVSF